MVLFMMKIHLLSIKIDSQPSLLSGILKGVSVETPETPLASVLCCVSLPHLTYDATSLTQILY